MLKNCTSQCELPITALTSALTWGHFWHMQLQLSLDSVFFEETFPRRHSAKLHKDIFRAKHPCRVPTNTKPHAVLQNSTVKRNRLIPCVLGPEAGFLQDAVSERQPCIAARSPALLPSLSPGHHSQVTQEEYSQEAVGGQQCTLPVSGSGARGCFEALSSASQVRWTCSSLRSFTCWYYVTHLAVWTAGSLLSTQSSPSLHRVSGTHSDLCLQTISQRCPLGLKAYFSWQIISSLLRKHIKCITNSSFMPVAVTNSLSKK